MKALVKSKGEPGLWLEEAPVYNMLILLGLLQLYHTQSWLLDNAGAPGSGDRRHKPTRAAWPGYAGEDCECSVAG